VDPIGHAAKLLWLLALIPVIFGAMSFPLSAQMSSGLATWQLAFP